MARVEPGTGVQGVSALSSLKEAQGGCQPRGTGRPLLSDEGSSDSQLSGEGCTFLQPAAPVPSQRRLEVKGPEGCWLM